MDLGLKDKVVIVTGSSQGIGYGIAKSFLAEGAKVMVTGRDKDNLEKAVESLGKTDNLAHFCGDMTNSTEIEKAIKETVKHFGGLDVVVANVGKGFGGGLDLTTEEWQNTLQTNFVGAMLLAAQSLPHLKKTQGNIIFISSIAGVEAMGASVSYSAAKAAVIGGMKSLARELGPSGVRVNAIAPGNIKFAGGIWEKKVNEKPEFYKKYIETEVPLQRFGTPEEIGQTAVFLASPVSAFTTGACFVVDGGQTKSY